MALRILQPGQGDHPDLLLCYLVRDEPAMELAAMLPPDAAVVTEKVEVFNQIGPGAVTPLPEVLAQLGLQAWGRLVLVGFSAGCQAVRVQLGSGVHADIALAADGIHVSDPPRADQAEPWQLAAARGAAGEMFFGCSYSQVPATKFLSTQASIARILQVDTSQLGTATDPAVQCQGRFCAYGVAGADHQAHLTTVLPRMLHDALASEPASAAEAESVFPWRGLVLGLGAAAAALGIGSLALRRTRAPAAVSAPRRAPNPSPARPSPTVAWADFPDEEEGG